jgi:hypothetical protein
MLFLESRTTITSEHYTATVKTLKQEVRWVWKHTKHIFQQPDNARPHTSQITMGAIEKLHLTILPHLSYSPDLAPCNFHLLPKTKTFVDICMTEMKMWKGLSQRR